MPLWTDIIEADALTAYARQSLADYEASNGTLARWLPNHLINGIHAKFVIGDNGLVEEARFRAYDAEPEIGKGKGGRRVTLELPAISQKIPVSEYQQLIAVKSENEAILRQVLATTDNVVRAIADGMERLRGSIILTGKATITQGNFVQDEDFGRDPALSYTAPTLWSTAGADRLTHLQAFCDLYQQKSGNGSMPGCLVMSRRAFRALQSGTGMSTALVGGGSRPATAAEVQAYVGGAGLPPIIQYNRRTASGLVLPDDRVFALPEPTDPNDPNGAPLGRTLWGTTLTASDPAYGLAAVDMPGVVAGVHRPSEPPMIAQVIGDGIGMPVAENANLAAVLKVL